MSSSSIESRYQQAMRLAAEGHMDAARMDLERIRNEYADHLPARYALGGLLTEAGDYEQAIAEYLAVLEVEPEHLDSHLALADILYRQKRFAAAEGAYAHVLGIDENHEDAWLGQVRSLWQKGDQDPALERLQSLLEHHPDNVTAWQALAQLSARAGRWAQCLLACDALMDAGVTGPEIELQRATALSGVAQWQASAQAFESLTDTEPDNFSAWVGLSAALGAQGDAKAARKASRRALRVQTQAPIGKGDIVVLRSLGPSYYQRSPAGHYVLERENNIDSHLDDMKVHEVYLERLDHDKALKQSISKAGLLINAVSDPDREPDALDKVQQITRSLSCPVINPPERIAQCTRDNNFYRFQSTPGLWFPRTVLTHANRLEEDLKTHGMDSPYILRRVGTHMGASVARIETDGDREVFLNANPNAPLYLIEYVDNPFKPGIYRRMRMMFVGAEQIAIGCHYHHDWNVHSADRSSVMREDASLVREEQAFVNDPICYLGKNAESVFQQIRESTGLEYFGVDFDLLDDGRLLIFEINAAMAPNKGVIADFPYLETPFRRLTNAVRQLATNYLET